MPHKLGDSPKNVSKIAPKVKAQDQNSIEMIYSSSLEGHQASLGLQKMLGFSKFSDLHPNVIQASHGNGEGVP